MSKPTVISLFSGAGGLDYGFEAAGYETSACVEMDRDCCATLRASRPDWNVVERPIADVDGKELLKVAKRKRRDVDVVIGGPPCQPFSKSGYWATGDSARLQDPRADTLSQYLRIVRETLPRVLVLENVQGLLFAGKDEGLRHLKEGISQINRDLGTKYDPVHATLNAAAYGVPQIRERVIMVAERNGARFAFPQPTHYANQQGDLFSDSKRIESYRTAWDAIGGLNPSKDESLFLRGKWADLLPSIPEGWNYQWHTARGVERARELRMKPGLELFGWRTRYWSFLLKLSKSLPSWTLQAQPGPACGPFHWSNRLLSVEELARLQTFPRNVRFQGGRGSIQKQIGNAVPSLLGEVLGREIGSQFLDQPRRRLKLSVPVNAEPPRTTPHKDVPEKFWDQVGKHRAHPGTGLGAGALRRYGGAAAE